MNTAEALNYDFDDVEIVNTPKETNTDKIVRCYTESELTDELANMLKDSISGVRKAELEVKGLEIRKRNREIVIRQKKKAKLYSIMELSGMIAVCLLLPLVSGLYLDNLVYFAKEYIVSIPAALYFARELKNLL